MNKFKNILVKFSLVTALVISSTLLHAQDLDKATVKTLIDSKNFTFKAQTVLPMTGGSRQLTSDYDVRFLGDSIVAYLPYFGRSYTATYGGEGGIDFTSTQFDYKAKARKKGGWDVSIHPKDAKDTRELNFTISDTGNTTLQVTSNNRQAISFHGYIVARK
jgi:hypothetical protein